MELENTTNLPARLLRTAIDDDRMMASVVVRVTYRIVGQRLVLHEEQPWSVSEKPWQTPYGVMEQDSPFRRGGVDLFVFGTAWAPGRQSTVAMELRIDVGAHVRRVLVIGDRRWRRFGTELVASDPQPFVSMPLSHAHAFGGIATWDGASMPYGDNPEGRGYYLDPHEAVDQSLPNLELPDSRVRVWNDLPEPACLGLCPQTNGLRVRNSLELDELSRIQQLRPTAFNCAFPRMILPAIEPGTPVWVQGIDPRGPVGVALPGPGLAVELGFDDENVRRVPFIDQIGIEADHQRMFITYRYPFRYVLIPKQVRSCRLVHAPALLEARP